MTGPALTPIGVVRTARRDTEHTPVQAALNPAETGVLELDPRYTAGLAGLTGFDHAWLICWLDSPAAPITEPELTGVPFLLRGTGKRMGVFATRGPRRVNPIGLSLVRLLDVTDNRITFAGVDLLDGTPVLDLKPYVTRFDRPPGEPRCGWFDTVAMPPAVTPAELGPADGGGRPA
jgi:tRNA-Thr(GGU) m(6)t(6)A37 methyltransferase TsaA